MKKILITLILLLTFGSGIAANNTATNQLDNNLLPSSNISKPLPYNTVMFGVTIIPGPGCYTQTCQSVYDNCRATGLSHSYCTLVKRDCQSICMGGWLL